MNFDLIRSIFIPLPELPRNFSSLTVAFLHILSISVNSQWGDVLNSHITFMLLVFQTLKINEIANVIQCFWVYLWDHLKVIVQSVCWIFCPPVLESSRIIHADVITDCFRFDDEKVWSRSQPIFINLKLNCIKAMLNSYESVWSSMNNVCTLCLLASST